MRKVVVFCHLSLDAIAAVSGGNLEWVSYDQELEKWAESVVAKTDTAIYGRVTYDLMKYWQTVASNPKASTHELKHARWIENVEKIVFSKSSIIPDWNNTTIINDNIQEEIQKLKQKQGNNITVFGSPTLANLLIRSELIDEYYLSVSPVVLGDGKRLFEGVKKPIKLVLVEEKTLKSGAITLHYTR